MRIFHEGAAVGAGIRKTDLVEWYLNEQQELDSQEAVNSMRIFVQKVIKLLMRRNLLVEVVVGNEKRLLTTLKDNMVGA